MKTRLEYVEVILDDCVRVVCVSGSLRQQLLLRGKETEHGACIPYTSKQTLAAVLSHLQSLQLPFGNAPGGWPPAAIFAQLRDEGLVNGSIRTITWSGPNQPMMGTG